MIWDPGRRRCSAAAMKDSMAATWALMLFLLPTAPVSAAKYASALTEPAQTQCRIIGVFQDTWCLAREPLCSSKLFTIAPLPPVRSDRTSSAEEAAGILGKMVIHF